MITCRFIGRMGGIGINMGVNPLVDMVVSCKDIDVNGCRSWH